MKLSTSSSHASTSTTTSSSSTITMSSSKSTNNAGCLTSIMRKVLCSRGLPTETSTQNRELEASNSMGSGEDQDLKAKQNATATTSSSPGIVARLMGLESIAEIPCSSKPGSLSRSKSMNSMDCLVDCNGMQGLQKRVKSTLSFREVPSFLLIENEKFLVFSFETGGESRGLKSSGRKKEMGCAEMKENDKREKVCDKKKGLNLIEKKKMSKRVSDMSCGNVRNGGKLQDITNTLHQSKASSEYKCFDSEEVKLSQSQYLNCKEVVVIGGKKKRRKRRKQDRNCQKENKIETECKPQDSSPVSVLDFEREACGTDCLNSRRKLSTELENDQNSHLRSDGNLVIDECEVKAIENNKYGGSRKKENEYTDTRGQVCRLVEDELHGWMNKQGELESLSAEFESEIFDYLLTELIDDQLVGHPHSQVCNFNIL